MTSLARAAAVVDVTLGPIIGTHTVSVAPGVTASESIGTILPFLKLTSGGSALDVVVESLPPVGPQRFGNDLITKISLVDASVRFHVNHTVAIGIGEAVVNQSTTYPLQREVEQSRISGGRYAVIVRPYARYGESLEFEAAVVPRLGGTIKAFAMRPSANGLVATREDEERGSAFDTTLRMALDRGAARYAIGLRYFQFSAAYARTGALADRNTVRYPFFEDALRIGQR